MIKFFRKIRQRALSENKFSKYLVYAIGEIVLVVIGILIALSVNNYSERQKQEALITEALKTIHRELSDDIKEANSVIDYYRIKDTLIDFILTTELSKEDFHGEMGVKYSSVGSNINGVNINTNGFESLMANSGIVPNKYKGLIEPLKEIYKGGKQQLEFGNKFLDETVTDYLSYLSKTKDWSYRRSYFGKLDDRAIDFYLNDATYKNHLADYHSAAINNYYADLHRMRVKMEDVYDELTNLLGLQNVIESDSTYYRYNSQDYLHFVGTYKDSRNTTIISMQDDKLLYQYNDDIKEYLMPISQQSFIIRYDDTFNDFKQDSTGKITHYSWHFGKSKRSMKRIE